MPNQDEELRKENSGNDAVGQLIANAGARRSIAPELEAEVRQSVHAEWQGAVRRRNVFRRGFAGLAAAAVILMTGIASLSMRHPHEAPIPVADFAVKPADTSVLTAASSSASKRLFVGDELRTGASAGVRLLTPSGALLRVAPQSHLAWLSATEIRLFQGAIYIESAVPQLVLDVHTAFGTVSHIGTRYSIQDTGDALIVNVRDGEVVLSAGHDRVHASGGEQLSVARNGRVERANIAVYGDAWSWIDALAPPFDLENHTLGEFLGWVARETGRVVVYGDDATKQSSSQVVLHGSIAGLSPGQALEAVMPATPAVVLQEHNRLIVHVREE